MIEVILYSREDCHLCEQVISRLQELQGEIPHTLCVVDIDSQPGLKKEYGLTIPVLKVGPYTLKAPIEITDLLVTLKAAQYREHQINEIDAAVSSGKLGSPAKWTKSDGFTYWLSKHYLAIFNMFVFLYVSLPFCAPIFMKAGATVPASWIYRIYGMVCHELAFRSWFLFGEQSLYPREAANIGGLVHYREATGLDDNDLWAARNYIGNEQLGYKVALCERDVAIYGGMLLFGIAFAISGRRFHSLNWIIWILVGLLPIGLDGLSQLASQPPLNWIPYRESTPLLRSLSGFLFGFVTAWFGYPYVQETMQENRRILETKLQTSTQALK